MVNYFKTFISIIILLFLCGCHSIIRKDNIVIIKSTVFGLDISTYPNNLPHIRFGLVRHFYQTFPTSTNGPVFAPQYSTYVNGDIGVTAQDVQEEFHIGNGNTNLIGISTNRVLK